MALEYKSYAPFVKRAQEAAAGVGKIASSLRKQAAAPAYSAAQSVANMVKTKLPTSLSSLGAQTTAYGGSTRYEKFHPGVDIANKIGTALPAFSNGTVKEVVRGKRQGDRGYGNYVVIQDEQGNMHRYSHLNDSYVQVGQIVQKGQHLGNIGNSGQTYSTSGGTGSHLDYRVKDLYGKYIDPYQFLK